MALWKKNGLRSQKPVSLNRVSFAEKYATMHLIYL